MEDVGRIVVQLAHVLGGVLWIGGGFYTMLVQLPALAVMPMAARGPALAALGPRQVRYIMRVAEFTIATGILQIFVSPRGRELTALSSRWATRRRLPGSGSSGSASAGSATPRWCSVGSSSGRW